MLLHDYQFQVTPHVGVWIETLVGAHFYHAQSVTPHVGVWIETCLILLLV